jgi:hypothetical protein
MPHQEGSPEKQCSRSSMYRAPRLERGGCRRDSCREYQLRRVSPTSRGAPLRTERLKVRILHAVPLCLSRCRALMARQGDKLAGDSIASLDAPNASTTFAHVVQRRDSVLKMRKVPVQIRPWAPRVAIGNRHPLCQITSDDHVTKASAALGYGRVHSPFHYACLRRS